ncbi:adenylate kinase isoenzyme 6-like [Cataglyphis hispanica]|uniref:adenylate kinase isoenzyme 6-like n=1 Tax=Cataglyphis hispanica TaxID=1086592 RepID=UPI00217FF8F8|nr:adenylate kinase isoenzyme 6-like [Cataglyphis hispanica]
MRRNTPNILVAGTPGVGKSLMSRILSEKTGLEWLDVSKIAIENECVVEYDDVYQTDLVDEEMLLEGVLDSLMDEGGKIVDFHSADFFPKIWFDIVFVLRTDNIILYDRLKERGYCGEKLEYNITCEISETILEEARSYYRTEIVYELISNTLDQVTDNVNIICQWLEQWKIDNQHMEIDNQ